MIKEKNSKDYLLQFATSEELSTSLQLVFRNFITAEMYTELPIKDREKLMFHWELLQDFFKEDVHAENGPVCFSDN